MPIMQHSSSSNSPPHQPKPHLKQVQRQREAQAHHLLLESLEASKEDPEEFQAFLAAVRPSLRRNPQSR